MPLLVAAWRTLRRLPGVGPAPDLALTLLSCGCIPLLFRFFHTEMHERYWHASILFLAAYGFLRCDYLPYILASVAYFLNLECAFHHLGMLHYDVLIFQPKFIAAIFALAILSAVIKIYRIAPLALTAARGSRYLRLPLSILVGWQAEVTNYSVGFERCKNSGNQ